MILLTAYLVGYFLIFGIVAGTSHKFDLDTFGTCLFLSLLSWIMVGVFLADFITKEDETKP